MTHSHEERLQADLERWAEAGAPTFDLGGKLERRLRQRRARWSRWGAVAAALLLFGTTATATFPAWAAAAADWPIIGAPIKAYLAERAGLSWAYKMGFFQANLGELTDGTVTLRVLGVLADPIQTKIFYQISGVDPNPKPIPIGEEHPPRPAELSVKGFDHQPLMFASSNSRINGWNEADQFYLTETMPLLEETTTLYLQLRVGELEKELAVPVSLDASSRHFTEITTEQTQRHGAISINLQRVTLSPAEVITTYEIQTPPGPFGGSSTRGILAPATLRHEGRELTGRATASFGINGVSHVAFERISGKSQLVIPTLTSPVEVNARWAWAPGSVAQIQGVPVTLGKIEWRGKSLSVDWSYPADSDLLGIGGFTLIGKDGTRLELRSELGFSSSTRDAIAEASITYSPPENFEPVAIEASHGILRIDGPWVFDLPELPAKP